MAQQCPTVSQNETDPAKLAFVIRELAQRISLSRQVLPALGSTFPLYASINGGSDAADGRSPSTPFQNVQTAINAAAALDLNGNGVLITLLTNGTYGGIAVSMPWVGGSGFPVKVLGDIVTPSNMTLSTSAECINVTGYGCTLDIAGVKIVSSGNDGIRNIQGARMNVSGLIEFGACGRDQIRSNQNAEIIFSANYLVSAGASNHINTVNNGVILCTGRSITVSNTPAFSNAFFNAALDSSAIFTGTVYSGPATGKRYLINSNASAQTGGNANFFPGNIAGTTDGSGSYS